MFLGLWRHKDDVVEASLSGSNHEGRSLGARAGQHEDDALVVAESFGGREDIAEAVGHAVGPDVADDEAAMKIPRGQQAFVLGPRRITEKIDPVDDNCDFVATCAARDQVLFERRRQRDDAG